MFTSIRRYLWRHFHTLGQALAQFVRAPLATVLTASVIGITLALPTGLYVVVDNLRRVSADWDTGGQISLFLKTDVNDANAERLAERLRRTSGVERVDFISRARALSEFKQLSGLGGALNALDQNPLPAVIVIHPSTNVAPARLQTLLDEVRELDGVDSAQLDIEWIQRLHALLSIIERGILVLASLLGLAVLLTIGNTIRLAVMNRRDEIEVMKLIGGTNPFIRRPFLYTGTLLGLFGAIAAWIILALTLLFISGPVTELGALYGAELEPRGLGVKASFILFGVGAALGWIGSRLAVSRHLRAIEPG